MTTWKAMGIACCWTTPMTIVPDHRRIDRRTLPRHAAPGKPSDDLRKLASRPYPGLGSAQKGANFLEARSLEVACRDCGRRLVGTGAIDDDLRFRRNFREQGVTVFGVCRQCAGNDPVATACLRGPDIQKYGRLAGFHQ